MEFRKLCNPPKACILVNKGPFAWFFSQHVVKFYFIAILPVNGILSKPSWVKLESDERPELVLWKSSHLDATFSDFGFKILPTQSTSTNKQWTICTPKLRWGRSDLPHVRNVDSRVGWKTFDEDTIPHF